MKKTTTLDPRMADPRPSRLRILPTFLTLALAGTAVSSAVEVSFQYYRFTPTKGRGGDAQNQIQMSEFEFFLRGAKVDHSALTVPGAVTGGITHPIDGAEGVSKLVDGDRFTKWFDDNKVPVTFNFGAPVTIDAYRFATANDALERTPVRWIMSGSNDGINFVTVDDRSAGDNATPTAFYTFRPLLITTPPAASGLPVFTTYNTTATVVDNTVSGQDVYQAFPSIVKNAGPETSLTWNVTNTPTSIAMTPALPPPDLLFSETRTLTPITPNVFTDYKLTATTAGGTGALIHKVRAVPGGSATARYVRFTASALRDGNNLVQMGEFEFFNGATKLTGITVTNPNGNTNNNANEVAAKIIDGDFRTKWLNHNNAPLIFDLGTAQTFDGYQLTTGNDASGRDPVRWVLETSADGVNWSLLDNVYNYQPPTIRRAKSGTIPLGGIVTREWTGSTDGTWDTTTTNWVNSGTSTPAVSYSEGTAVVFGEASTSREVSLAAPLSPNSVSVLNTTGTYTFSGEPLTGPGDLFKRGAGELVLDSANAIQGAVFVEGGKLTLNNAESIGNRDILTRLQVSDGAELHVTSDVTTDRRLRIGTGGATVNVDEGFTFTKTNSVDFLGTLTKTGFGTLRFNGYQGSTSVAASDLVINEGTVDFTAAISGFNSRPFGGNAGDNMIVTINSLGTMRWSVANALGGDQVNFQTSLDQVRILGGVLDITTGFNYIHVGLAPSGEGRIVMQGGVITGNGQLEPAGLTPTTPTPVRFTILPSADTSFIGGGGAIALNPGNASLEVDVADGEAVEDLIINRVISGDKPLIKMGAGNMVLAAPNTFSGLFTVSAGTVTLSNSSTGTSNASFATGTTLQGTGSMGSATINGAVKVSILGSEYDQFALAGTLDLGATSSLAISGEEFTEPSYILISNVGARTGTFGTVTGVPTGYTLNYSANAITLVSTTASAYDAWALAEGLTDPSPEADEDKDGLANVLEFVLNSNAKASSLADAPDVTRNAQGDFIFTFVMKAEAGYLAPEVEYATALDGTWTTFATPVTVVDTPSAGLNTVTATLPAALASPEGKLFARLKVVTDG